MHSSILKQTNKQTNKQTKQTNKMSDDLLLDPAIRIWVIVPIVMITFLVGVIRHHVSILLTSPKKVCC